MTSSAWHVAATIMRQVVFDLDDPMGNVDLRRLRRMRAGLPHRRADAEVDRRQADAWREAAARTRASTSVCPFCGVGCLVSLRGHATGAIAYVEGVDGPANEGRLCVKGRFGFDYVASPQRLTVPLIRRADAPKGLNVDPRNPFTHFRQATWDEALDAAAARHGAGARAGHGQPGAGRVRLGQSARTRRRICSRSWCARGFGSNNVDHCTRLCHASSVAALMEGIGSGGCDRALCGGDGGRGDRGDRRQSGGESSGRGHLLSRTRCARTAPVWW